MIILIKIKPKVVEKLYRSQSISPRIILFLLDSICISAYTNFYPICKKKYDFNNPFLENKSEEIEMLTCSRLFSAMKSSRWE